MTRYYTKLQIKLTQDSLLSIAARIFLIISSTSRDILKIALLIIIASYNSHIRPMLIHYSNSSFVGPFSLFQKPSATSLDGFYGYGVFRLSPHPSHTIQLYNHHSEPNFQAR